MNLPTFISRHVYPPLLNIVVRVLCVCWRLEAISRLMARFYAGSCIQTSENSSSTHLGEYGCFGAVYTGRHLFRARERRDEIVGTIAEPRKGALWLPILRTG